MPIFLQGPNLQWLSGKHTSHRQSSLHESPLTQTAQGYTLGVESGSVAHRPRGDWRVLSLKLCPYTTPDCTLGRLFLNYAYMMTKVKLARVWHCLIICSNDHNNSSGNTFWTNVKDVERHSKPMLFSNLYIWIFASTYLSILPYVIFALFM